jgi:hypothetical protein
VHKHQQRSRSWSLAYNPLADSAKNRLHRDSRAAPTVALVRRAFIKSIGAALTLAAVFRVCAVRLTIPHENVS